jgi:REP element-mobilizing transposase RayT
MTFNPDIHYRRSIRLRGFDYASAGAYFVTVCAQNRDCLFGTIDAGRVQLNAAGRMVQDVWQALPHRYPGIAIDTHVVMPNHSHGIIILGVGAGPRACPVTRACENQGHPQGGAPAMSLPEVVHRFKSLSTARYRQGVAHQDWLPFPGRLWQRNYHERVIRNETELLAIREYIVTNPLKWDQDKENPDYAK